MKHTSCSHADDPIRILTAIFDFSYDSKLTCVALIGRQSTQASPLLFCFLHFLKNVSVQADDRRLITLFVWTVLWICKPCTATSHESGRKNRELKKHNIYDLHSSHSLQLDLLFNLICFALKAE